MLSWSNFDWSGTSELSKKCQKNPVLTGESSWESYGIRDPAMLCDSSGQFVQENGLYRMYYNGREDTSTGATKIGMAETLNGIDWDKCEDNPVFSDGTYATVGSVIRLGDGDFIMYYCMGTTTGFNYATSEDGIDWTKYATGPILTRQDYSNLSMMGGPFVTQIDSTWYMVFEAKKSGTYRILMATSNDGLEWSAANGGEPIYAPESGWDRLGQANPALYELTDGRFAILYNGKDGGNQWELGMILSDSLTSGWEQVGPIITHGASGEWDGVRIEGPRMVIDDDAPDIAIWYLGLPTVDSYKDGKIGCAILNRGMIGI